MGRKKTDRLSQNNPTGKRITKVILVFTVPLYRNKNTNCLNKHTNTCFICNRELGISNKWDYHHILRIPSITVKVHRECHLIIERDTTDKYSHLKPTFKTCEVDYIRWAYINRHHLKELFKFSIPIKRLLKRERKKTKSRLQKKSKAVNIHFINKPQP